jgi:hypothetical protein
MTSSAWLMQTFFQILWLNGCSQGLMKMYRDWVHRSKKVVGTFLKHKETVGEIRKHHLRIIKFVPSNIYLHYLPLLGEYINEIIITEQLIL